MILLVCWAFWTTTTYISFSGTGHNLLVATLKHTNALKTNRKEWKLTHSQFFRFCAEHISRWIECVKWWRSHTHTHPLRFMHCWNEMKRNEEGKLEENQQIVYFSHHHDLKFLENAFISTESISETTVIIVLLSALWFRKLFFWEFDG